MAKAKWTKGRAIGDLVRVKNKAMKSIADDQKAASTVLTSIKELNSLCGFNKQEKEQTAEKVVIKDDI